MKYRCCFEEGKRVLTQAQIAEADLDARLLLEFVCGTNRNDLLVHGDQEVDTDKEHVYRELLSKRAKHVPLQHLTGVQEFMGLEFKVNSNALIPRQDTEILVEEVLKELHDGMRILDLCTGSGCILISLLHYSNDCSAVGCDISQEALQLAEENACRLLKGGHGSCKADFVLSDLFEQVEGRFDRIVSNPPYIKTGVISTLMPEVREYEPAQALDGREDGLYFYQKIVSKSPRYLVSGGRLYFEIGYDQGQAVCDLMRNAGFREIEVTRDYAGLDRVVSGTFIK